MILLDCIEKMIELCDRLTINQHDKWISVLEQPKGKDRLFRAIVPTSDFAAAIKSAYKVVPKKPRHKVLGHLAIKTDGNKIIIQSSDLTTFLSINVDARIIEFGSVVIPAMVTNQLTQVLPAGELEIKAELPDMKEYTENLVSFAGNTSNQVLQGVHPDEWIAFPDAGNATNLIIDSHQFIKAFTAVSKHVSKKVTHQDLQGVHLGNGRLLASDGHKIAFTDLLCVGNNPSAIIYPSFVKYLKDICPENRMISIDVRDGFIRAITPHGEVVQRTLEGENIASFKAATSKLPAVEVNRKDLINKIELAQLCTNQIKGSESTMFLSIKDGWVLGVETGMSEDEIFLEEPVDIDDVTIAVDCSKFLSLLKTVRTETVKIKLPNNNQIISVEADDVNLGVMPLRLSVDPVKVTGAGYAPAWELPYTYKDKCLTVTRSEHGFTRAEFLADKPQETTPTAPQQQYKPQSYQEWCEENPEEYAAHQAWCEQERDRAIAERRSKAQHYFENQPTTILESVYKYETDKITTLLKQHYKTLDNFKEVFPVDPIGGIRSWKQGKDCYISYAITWDEIIKGILDARCTPVT